MTPSYFQAISGDNGDLWTRTRKGKRFLILEPGSWILVGHGGAARPGAELLLPQRIPNLWNYSLHLETWWKIQPGEWKGEIVGFWGVWECVSMDWCSAQHSLSQTHSSAPDPILTFHKNQHLFQISFPGELKIPGFIFFFPWKTPLYPSPRKWENVRMGQGIWEAKKKLEFWNTAPSPLLLPPSPPWGLSFGWWNSLISLSEE